MPGPSYRDRFFTPRVARSIFSPWGIALAAGVIAVALVAGLPVLAAVALGLVAWAAKVLASVPRARPERIDPFTVQDPWRRFVQEALQVRNRFDEVVHRLPEGPLHDRLAEVAGRIHAAAGESYRIARQGQALDQARRGIDVKAVERQRAEVAGAAEADPADPVVAELAASLEAQQASADRLGQVIGDAQARLRLLDARLDMALAQARELAAQSGSATAADELGTDVDDVVIELEALRQALEETHGTPGGLSAPGGLP